MLVNGGTGWKLGLLAQKLWTWWSLKTMLHTVVVNLYKDQAIQRKQSVLNCMSPTKVTARILTYYWEHVTQRSRVGNNDISAARHTPYSTVKTLQLWVCRNRLRDTKVEFTTSDDRFQDRLTYRSTKLLAHLSSVGNRPRTKDLCRHYAIRICIAIVLPRHTPGVMDVVQRRYKFVFN